MKDITICFTYFRSLTLANLAAALYSLRQQDLSRVESMLVLDNNTTDSIGRISDEIECLDFPIPVGLIPCKHNDPTKTHSWSTNGVVLQAKTPWVLFTRADYVLDFDLLKKFTDVIDSKPKDWNGFVTGNGCHMQIPVEAIELTSWRHTRSGPRSFTGIDYTYTVIDTGVWMARLKTYEAVEGLDEKLTAWGHAQTHFQWKMHKAGVEFVRIPEVLFWHPAHGGQKDIDVAHAQLKDLGLEIQDLWSRYEGENPYGR